MLFKEGLVWRGGAAARGARLAAAGVLSGSTAEGGERQEIEREGERETEAAKEKERGRDETIGEGALSLSLLSLYMTFQRSQSLRKSVCGARRMLLAFLGTENEAWRKNRS